MAEGILKTDGDEYVDLEQDCTRVCIVGAMPDISGTFTNEAEQEEDTPHVSGDAGTFILAVRNDNNTALTDANGDYSPIAVDSAGQVKVTGTVSVSEPVTIDGTVELGAASLAALESVTVSGTVSVSEPVTVDGTVTVVQGTDPWVVGDGGGSITVDGIVSVAGEITLSGSVYATQPVAGSRWQVADVSSLLGDGSVSSPVPAAGQRIVVDWITCSAGAALTPEILTAPVFLLDDGTTTYWACSGTIPILAGGLFIVDGPVEIMGAPGEQLTLHIDVLLGILQVSVAMGGYILEAP